MVRKVAHALKRNPLSDLNKILHGGRYPRRNHLCQDRLRGLGVAGSQSLPFSIDFDRRPYNTLALPCECVMGIPYPQRGGGTTCLQFWPMYRGYTAAWIKMPRGTG